MKEWELNWNGSQDYTSRATEQGNELTKNSERDGPSTSHLTPKHKNELKWSGKCRNGKINGASPTSFFVTHTQICCRTTIWTEEKRMFAQTL